ncbi:YkgJ family cysteine cluster protein [Cytobacillus solani]|uniref:Fe-S oxidoreductase n=1 Tax=Cytobacillus solani TaxID=1637975 RepID=A0A0Q3QL66_9BACI|nr:YkgJ family cysteine cluster protein [Cytobacillus solani]KQL18360.1 Fe-S oxidoreductase [Cytobacillus solani]
MEILPCKGCKGMCCGPVPITENERMKIQKAIRKMPVKKRMELKNQQRYIGTCIFFDEKNDRCGIHSARPSICKAFGHYQNLVCFKSPNTVSAKKYYANEPPIGLLSVDFTWKDFT